MRRLSLSLFTFAALLIAACSSQSPCGPSNCDGCCDPVSDQCLSGTDRYSCGIGGKTCVACTGSLEGCVTSRPDGGTPEARCTVCDSSTCSGCCDGSTLLCKPGTAEAACGADGLFCQTCGPNLVCNPSSGQPFCR